MGRYHGDHITLVRLIENRYTSEIPALVMLVS